MAPLSLVDLDTDALRAILLRTCAEDHPNLRKTCTRVASILDSSEFHTERCEGGWAQISTRLWTPYEMYADANEDESCSSENPYFLKYYDTLGYNNPDLGFREGQVDLLVDGVKAGTSTFKIIPRRNSQHGSIHIVADSVSGELHNVTLRFFDRKGKPRLESIRHALGTKDTRAGLLYIATFKLNDPSYRTTAVVGAHMLRSLLTQDKLKGEWSVAAYIPEAAAQFTPEDEETNQERRMNRMEHFYASMMEDADDTPGDGNDTSWEQRREDLIKQDMRQFFSAGFQQAKETVWTSECFHVFAVPSFMDVPMLSHQEANLVAIFEKPLSKCAPTGAANELLKAMKQFCCDKNQLLNNKNDKQRLFDAPMEHVGATPVGHVFKESIERHQASTAKIRPHIVGRQEKDRDPVLANLWVELQDIEQELIEAIRSATGGQEKLDALDAEMKQLDGQVRAKVTELVERSGAGIVLASDAIHACAYNLNPEYVRLLLDFVPEPEKRNVINSLDQHGATPLMSAAISTNFNGYSIRMRLQTCRVVVELGADRSIVDASGLTALGRFRQADRDLTDSQLCFGVRSALYNRMRDAVPEMEEFLLPAGGATPSDEAMLDDSDESESSNFDEEDEGYDDDEEE